ncbi:MAG: hypothetical protein U5K29_00635 [Acidimicrobiales bacterium]|nr:hypothetical protein [Acidimicrobiales bacterium]
MPLVVGRWAVLGQVGQDQAGETRPRAAVSLSRSGPARLVVIGSCVVDAVAVAALGEYTAVVALDGAGSAPPAGGLDRLGVTP